jgi:hypothetical protein
LSSNKSKSKGSKTAAAADDDGEQETEEAGEAEAEVGDMKYTAFLICALPVLRKVFQSNMIA